LRLIYCYQPYARMKSIKALLWAIAAIVVINQPVFAQAPTVEGSEYKYLYSLDKQQVRWMIDSPWFSAHNPIKTQPIDSVRHNFDFNLKNYPRGYYFTAKASNLVVNTQLLIHQPYFPIVQETNQAWWVVIKDTLQDVVKGGKLTLIQTKQKDTVFGYDSSCMCYQVPLQKDDHWFLFEKGEVFYYLYISSPYKKVKKVCTRPWYKFWKKCRPTNYYNSGYNYYYRPNRLKRFFNWVGRGFTRPTTAMQLNPGYIVINQPEFKQLDTLKMKAFLVNRRGKPLKKDLYVKVTPQYEGEKNLVYQKIKPQTHGAYTFDMAIPDTFLIDRNYIISVCDKKGRAYKWQVFKVADYELKKVSYSWEKQLGEYYRGNDIIFYAKSVDANGLPLPDATVRLKLKITSVNNIYDSLIAFNDSVFTIYYDTLLACSPDGVTPIKLPPHLVPNADITVLGEMIFTNADNQPGYASANFNIMADSKRYYLVPDSNGLRAGFLVQGRDTKGNKARWQVNYVGDVKQIKEITLPYYQNWEPGASSYYLLDSAGNVITNYTMSGNIPKAPIFAINKKYDSLHITLENPLGIELGWRIYNDKKLMETGAGRKLTLHKKLKNNDAVHVIYSYTWAGNFYTYETTAWAQEKQLTVKIEQPEIVYPGQEIAVDITVTDYKNKAAKNVNLTAYSVNMEFDNIVQPQLPYYGKNYLGILNTNRTAGISDWASRHGYSQSQILNNYLYNKLQLAGQPYYKLMFAPQAIGIVTDSLAGGKTQLSVFAKTQQVAAVDYYILWVDGKMVYYRTQGTGYIPNAFTVSPGKHKIQFRGNDGMYELDSIDCIAGMRTLVGVNLDSVYNNRTITRTEIKDGLSKEERNLYLKNILFIGTKSYYNAGDTLTTAYFKQGEKVYSMGRRNGSYWQENVGYFAVGPFEKGWVDMIAKDTVISFYFNPEYLYLYSNKQIFSSDVNYADYAPAGLTSVCYYGDTATELPPPPKEAPTVNVIKNYNTTNPFQHPGIRYYNPPYWSGKGNVYHLFLQELPHIRKVWFMNLDSAENSTIIESSYSITQRIKPGNYDVLFITDTNSYKLLRNVKVDDSLHTYFRPSAAGYAAYDSVALWPYITQVKILNRGPIPQFYKTPMKLLVKLDKENTKTPEKLIGEFSINGRYINNALIVIEDGRGNYVNGGLTNDYGYYQVSAVPGNYVMKVFTSQWDMFYAENVQISTGKNTIANLHINNYTAEVRTISYSNLPPGQRSEQLGSNGQQLKYNNTVSGNCTANCGEIRGIVTDAQTGEELYGVTVLVEATNTNIITDVDGSYRIKNLSPGTYNLVFRYTGYETIKITGITVITGQIIFADAKLRENTMELNEVMITESARMPIVKRDELGATSYSYNATPTDERNYYLNGVRTSSVETIVSKRRNKGRYNVGTEEENKEAAYDEMDAYNPFRGNVFSADDGVIEKDSLGRIVYRDAESSRLQRMLGDTNALKIRKTFRDYGYWIPNLTTNRKGKAGFTVRLPDNQTQWVSYVPAMDGKRRSGLGISYIKAYKPLTGNLSVPRVMVAGDRLQITGKTVNYTADSVVVNALLRVNDSDLYNSPMGVRYYQLVQQFLQPAQAGEVAVQYSIKTESGYTDGEIRAVPVLANGLLINQGETRTLEGETAFTLYPQQGQQNRELLISNRKLETLQAEIDKLIHYQYGCVEQTASKLKALLLQKQFAGAMGKEFTDEKLIHTCIKRLEKFQHPNGSWGWWDKTATDHWMTLYATDALLQATAAGYKTKSAISGASYLWSIYYGLPYGLKVASLEVFIKAGYGTASDKIAGLDTLNLTLQQRYTLLKAKQLAGQKISTDTLLKTVRYVGDKQAVWGEKLFSISVNELQTSAIAYDILRNQGGHDSLLKKVRNYFLSVPHTTRNTIESATVLQTFMQDIADEDAKRNELLPQLTINGKTPALPLLMKVGETDTIAINKNGSELFYVYSWQNFIPNPEENKSAFVIATQFEQNGVISDTVNAGKPVTMKVIVTTDISRDYVMVEVPIPAGFSYQSKKIGYRELYREHFDDKVAIFFDKLPRGKYFFTVELLPKFVGEVTLLPARAEEMYFPLNFGNNTKRKVVIK
jgi:hypothetical protein